MLLQSLVAALASSLALEAMASPLSQEYSGVQTKRGVPSSHSLHERHLPQLSHQWTKKEKVSETQILPMRIGLKQCNLEAGHDKLMDM
jgi:tripeptidyl-peptidase I